MYYTNVLSQIQRILKINIYMCIGVLICVIIFHFRKLIIHLRRYVYQIEQSLIWLGKIECNMYRMLVQKKYNVI